MGLAMVLIFFGTLAQARMGTWEAQQLFFNRWWVTAPVGDFSLPIFPGGLTIGALWFVNLLAAFFTRFPLKRNQVGTILSHAGLLLLLAGQFFTQRLSIESQMPIREGETSNFTISAHKTELALTRTTNPAFDDVTSIPESILKSQGMIVIPHSPLTLRIRRYFLNARLTMAQPGSLSIANQGMGPQIEVEALPPQRAAEDEANAVTAYVEVFNAQESLGVWLLSSALGAPQKFTANGESYQMIMRPKRYILPFSLTLQKFTHDRYPGTDIPKNFASRVRLKDASHKEDREVLIFMNNPLRYRGLTFYQASYGENDQLSVFQVVKNPARHAPYISCAMIIIGLAIQFLTHLIGWRRRKS